MKACYYYYYFPDYYYYFPLLLPLLLLNQRNTAQADYKVTFKDHITSIVSHTTTDNITDNIIIELS